MITGNPDCSNCEGKGYTFTTHCYGHGDYRDIPVLCTDCNPLPSVAPEPQKDVFELEAKCLEVLRKKYSRPACINPKHMAKLMAVCHHAAFIKGVDSPDNLVIQSMREQSFAALEKILKENQ